MVRQIVFVLAFAALGAAVGWFLHWFCDWLERRAARQGFTEHADEAIGLTAPSDAAVLEANRAPLSEREALAFQDLVDRFDGSYYVPGPEVSDD